MSSSTLDASAVIALLHGETGSALVAGAVIEGAAICTVNVSEVVATLSDAGMPEALIREALNALNLEIVDFDAALAFTAGMLRRLTRKAELSFGDRACLALALQRNLPVFTADQVWGTLHVGVTVRVIR